MQAVQQLLGVCVWADLGGGAWGALSGSHTPLCVPMPHSV